MEKTLEEYKNYINYFSVNQINREFLNSNKEHAIIVFEELFKSKQKCICVFAGDMSSDVCNSSNYIDSLDEYLEEGGEVKILLTDYNAAVLNLPLMRRLSYLKHKGKNISVRYTNTKFVSSDGDICHFTTDGVAYRFENDTDNFKARCNFNDTKVSSFLENEFAKIFVNATPIELKWI